MISMTTVVFLVASIVASFILILKVNQYLLDQKVAALDKKIHTEINKVKARNLEVYGMVQLHAEHEVQIQLKAHLAKIESDKKPREWSVLQMEAPQDLDSDDEDFVCECKNCKDRPNTECSKYIEMEWLQKGKSLKE